MTGAELALAFRAHRRRTEREHDDAMAVAWTSEALSRSGRRLPPLRSLLIGQPDVDRSPEDLLAEFAAVEEAFADE